MSGFDDDEVLQASTSRVPRQNWEGYTLVWNPTRKDLERDAVRRGDQRGNRARAHTHRIWTGQRRGNGVNACSYTGGALATGISRVGTAAVPHML